jgi:alkylated DNA repair dioxygenase AlkB
MPPIVAGLLTSVERLTGGRYNSVLCNLYRDGRDTVGWHSDDEPLFGSDPEVASLSFGGARTFQLRHKTTKALESYSLGDHDVLFMGRGVQAEWEHRLVRTAKPVPARINLTFRLTV